MRQHFFKRSIVALVILPMLLAGCDTVNPNDSRVIEGVDFDLLFAPPTDAEIEAVRQDWQGRDLSPGMVVVTHGDVWTLGGTPMQSYIMELDVQGGTHYGAVIAPVDADPGSLPVLVYAHGGDQGVDVDDVRVLGAALGDAAGRFIYVVPSFRSEPLIVDGVPYVSGGVPSPWDQDVDDALRLLNAALAYLPAADPGRIGVVGFSRGGGVALLMGIRDPRIDVVVDFFGPTDFFDSFVQEVTADALRGTLRELPGLAHLNESIVQPLKAGALTIPEARLELVRRSAVLFAGDLPDVQVHHGEEDAVVQVSQAESLRRTLQELGRSEPSFEYYTYPSAGHSILELSGSIDRTRQFVSRLLLSDDPI